MFKKSLCHFVFFLALFLLTNVATAMPQGQVGDRTETFTLNDLLSSPAQIVPQDIVMQGGERPTECRSLCPKTGMLNAWWCD